MEWFLVNGLTALDAKRDELRIGAVESCERGERVEGVYFATS